MLLSIVMHGVQYMVYKDERQSFVKEFPVNLSNLSIPEKFTILMQENNILAFAKYVWKIYEKRKGKLFG